MGASELSQPKQEVVTTKRAKRKGKKSEKEFQP